jgi:hypothetical protein
MLLVKRGSSARRDGETAQEWQCKASAGKKQNEQRLDFETCLAGGEVVEPAHEAGAILGVHGDNLDAHTFIGTGAADDGAGANLAFGGVKQQLNVRVQGEWLLDTDEKSAQREIRDA